MIEQKTQLNKYQQKNKKLTEIDFFNQSFQYQQFEQIQQIQQQNFILCQEMHQKTCNINIQQQVNEQTHYYQNFVHFKFFQQINLKYLKKFQKHLQCIKKQFINTYLSQVSYQYQSIKQTFIPFQIQFNQKQQPLYKSYGQKILYLLQNQRIDQSQYYIRILNFLSKANKRDFTKVHTLKLVFDYIIYKVINIFDQCYRGMDNHLDLSLKNVKFQGFNISQIINQKNFQINKLVDNDKQRKIEQLKNNKFFYINLEIKMALLKKENQYNQQKFNERKKQKKIALNLKWRKQLQKFDSLNLQFSKIKTFGQCLCHKNNSLIFICLEQQCINKRKLCYICYQTKHMNHFVSTINDIKNPLFYKFDLLTMNSENQYANVMFIDFQSNIKRLEFILDKAINKIFTKVYQRLRSIYQTNMKFYQLRNISVQYLFYQLNQQFDKKFIQKNYKIVKSSFFSNPKFVQSIIKSQSEKLIDSIWPITKGVKTIFYQMIKIIKKKYSILHPTIDNRAKNFLIYLIPVKVQFINLEKKKTKAICKHIRYHNITVPYVRVLNDSNTNVPVNAKILRKIYEFQFIEKIDIKWCKKLTYKQLIKSLREQIYQKQLSKKANIKSINLAGFQLSKLNQFQINELLRLLFLKFPKLQYFSTHYDDDLCFKLQSRGFVSVKCEQQNQLFIKQLSKYSNKFKYFKKLSIFLQSSQILTSEKACILLQQMKQISHLKISHQDKDSKLFSIDNNSQLYASLSRVRQLKYLKLTDVKSTYFLQEIFMKNPLLKMFSLIYSLMYNQPIQFDVFKSLSIYCKQLQKLQVWGYNYITSFINQMKTLKVLSLRNCLFKRQQLWILISNLMKLQYLDIGYNHPSNQTVRFNRNSLVSTQTYQFTPIANQRGYYIIDYLLQNIGKKLLNLKYLNIQMAHFITFQGIRNLTNLQKLQYLNICGTMIKPYDVQILSQHCKRLHKIYFANKSIKLPNIFDQKIYNQSMDLQTFEKLNKNLKITHFGIVDSTFWLTDQMMSMFSKSLKCIVVDYSSKNKQYLLSNIDHEQHAKYRQSRQVDQSEYEKFLKEKQKQKKNQQYFNKCDIFQTSKFYQKYIKNEYIKKQYQQEKKQKKLNFNQQASFKLNYQQKCRLNTKNSFSTQDQLNSNNSLISQNLQTLDDFFDKYYKSEFFFSPGKKCISQGYRDYNTSSQD